MFEMLQSLTDKFDDVAKQNSEMLTKLDNIETSLASLDNKITTIENKTETHSVEIEALKYKQTQIKTKTANEVSNNDIMHMHGVISAQAKLVKQETRNNTAYSQRHNLIFEKVPENKDKDCKGLI